MVEPMPENYTLFDRKTSGIEKRPSGDAIRRACVAPFTSFPKNCILNHPEINSRLIIIFGP
jgi:hypothetical protein